MNENKIVILVLDITLKGGIERFISNLSRMLESQGYNVEIISFHKTYEEPLYDFSKNTKIRYVTNLSFRKFFYKFTSIFSLLKTLKYIKTKKTNDILISTHPITTILISLFDKNILSRVVASEHSTYMSHGKIIRYLRKNAYRGVKSITTQTRDGVNCFKRDGLTAIQIENSVSETFDGKQWKRTSKNSEKVFTCLSLARFESVKQLDHLITAAKIVQSSGRKIKVNIVGDGPLRKQLELQIEKLSLTGIVELHLPTKTIGDFYSNADVYLISSSSEAFPMTMLEALSYGVPIISYDKLAGPSEVVKNGDNGLLCTQNCIENFSEQLIKLIDDPELNSLLGDNALRSASIFSSKNIAQKWSSLLSC